MNHIRHVPSGIDGFDAITDGGLPQGRATLVCGGPGSGKTLFGVQFVVNGAVKFGEPGVLISFEETPDELIADVAGLGWDLPRLVEDGLVAIDHVAALREEIEQTGAYDLSGLFVRLDYAISKVGAKRIVLDTPEALFAAFDDTALLRSEMRRLFRWLKDKGITTVITAERGQDGITRHGFEEYVSDAVVVLDHRVYEQTATRRLRVVKFRGSTHGTNEYPFMLDRRGFSVVPITAFDLGYESSTERVSTGFDGLDEMLDGAGFFRATTAMVSGGSGTGKTTIAAQFAGAASARGERVLYLSFEESAAQIMRNMRSVGLDLASAVESGLLRFAATRPTQAGLEGHLTMLYGAVEEFEPTCVVLDPITDFQSLGSYFEIKAMLMRMVDFLKVRGITALFTSITPENVDVDPTISSLIDTWIQVRNTERNGERKRGLYVLKSRGMPHSNRIREFEFTPSGLKLTDDSERAG